MKREDQMLRSLNSAEVRRLEAVLEQLVRNLE